MCLYLLVMLLRSCFSHFILTAWQGASVSEELNQWPETIPLQPLCLCESFSLSVQLSVAHTHPHIDACIHSPVTCKSGPHAAQHAVPEPANVLLGGSKSNHVWCNLHNVQQSCHDSDGDNPSKSTIIVTINKEAQLHCLKFRPLVDFNVFLCNFIYLLTSLSWELVTVCFFVMFKDVLQTLILWLIMEKILSSRNQKAQTTLS